MILFLIKLSQNETIFDFQNQEKEFANQSEYYNQDKGEEEETNNIEDYYDYRQTYLKAMLDSVSGESIKEIWCITSYMFTNPYQHIIIFQRIIYRFLKMTQKSAIINFFECIFEPVEFLEYYHSAQD